MEEAEEEGEPWRRAMEEQQEQEEEVERKEQ